MLHFLLSCRVSSPIRGIELTKRLFKLRLFLSGSLPSSSSSSSFCPCFGFCDWVRCWFRCCLAGPALLRLSLRLGLR